LPAGLVWFSVFRVAELHPGVCQGPNESELKRDFTYIDDIVAGVIGSTDTAPPSTKATKAFRVFNLGNTNPTSVSAFVDILEKLASLLPLLNLCLSDSAFFPFPPAGSPICPFVLLLRLPNLPSSLLLCPTLWILYHESPLARVDRLFPSDEKPRIHGRIVSPSPCLLRHIGKKALRNYIPVPPTGDVLATHADISNAKQVRQPRLIQ
jgi:hypothetical protein